MEFALVVAIVGFTSLDAAEKGLRRMGVRSITVTKVKGYGEYADFLSRDHLIERVKIEAFVPRQKAHLAASAILDATGEGGEELVAILSLDAFCTASTASSNA